MSNAGILNQFDFKTVGQGYKLVRSLRYSTFLLLITQEKSYNIFQIIFIPFEANDDIQTYLDSYLYVGTYQLGLFFLKREICQNSSQLIFNLQNEDYENILKSNLSNIRIYC